MFAILEMIFHIVEAVMGTCDFLHAINQYRDDSRRY
jgi:hypothetical protein